MKSEEESNQGPPLERRQELYGVAHLLSEESKFELGLVTTATIYLQDPLVARERPELGLGFIDLDWEPGFTDGPTGERIAVVDYNADTNILAKPAMWNKRKWCFTDSDGQILDFLRSDTPQFRQVNTWAIVHDILTMFQHPRVMGRPIPWAFEGNRLIVVPDAGYDQNAYYDRSSKSLQFYHFGSTENPVYTCLSHDIVAHETGHAILDGIRPFYNEQSSIQNSAFHEFLADLTAIISAFRITEIRYAVADKSGGDLRKDTVIGDLAEMFGQDDAVETQGEAARPYLRTAYNQKTMSYLKDNWSCHDCSKVLTGALFEILTEITLKQKSLIGHNNKCNSPRQALWNAVTHFTRFALRALDFCPPVDIQFIDYARALLQADKLAFPRDELGYREIIRKVFHKRGLCEKIGEHKPSDCDLEPLMKPYNVEFHQFDIGRVSSSRTAAYHFLNMNRHLLNIPLKQDIAVVDLYDTDKVVSAGVKLPKEIVMEYIWREDVVLEGEQFGNLEGDLAQLLCGGTIVFDERGNVLYFVNKPGVEEIKYREEGEIRKRQFLDYLASLVEMGMVGLTDKGDKGAVDLWKPAVEGRRIGGSLRFEATPRLRCHGPGSG